MDGERVAREIELPTADGVVRGRVAVPVGPMRLAGLAPTAFALTDALVRRAGELVVLQGKSISCRAGCGACCRHMVPLSPPEAFYLMDVIDGFDAVRRARVMARFEAVTARLEREGMIEELLDPPTETGDVLPVARRYFALQQPCPFLDEESCTVHAHRPAVCRDYNVTSPAEWCSRPYEREIEKVPMPLPLAAPLARVFAAVTGLRACLVPLTLAPRWAAAHAGLRARTWPGVELFDRFVEELHRPPE